MTKAIRDPALTEDIRDRVSVKPRALINALRDARWWIMRGNADAALKCINEALSKAQNG
jgi:hypothetical protein